jgi:uncharacterized glyoxalase superfamily protein PhnB
MLAVPDAREALAWYKRALGATELWNLGSVVAVIARALEAGAKGSATGIRDHRMPWGTHRQGSFVDPFGHKWLVGDRSPLSRHP